MKFPENILADDEQVARDLRPHWMTVVLPTVVGILIVALVALIAWLTPDEQGWNIFEWVMIGIGVILLIALVVVPYLRWRTTHYVITNKRVVVRRGILSKQGKDIALSRITDVSFNQSLFDRIIRSGTLTVESAGDAPNEQFKNIPRSNQVQQLINRLVEDDIDNRGFYGSSGRQMRAAAGGHGRDPYPDEAATRGWEHGDPSGTGERPAHGTGEHQQPPAQQWQQPPAQPGPSPQTPQGQWPAQGPAQGGWETPPR